MPPEQPIQRCHGPCGLLRPCKVVGGPWLRFWLCVDCNPFVDVDDEGDDVVDANLVDQIDAGVEPPTAAESVATDGGSS
jgi:hypothetical protein